MRTLILAGCVALMPIAAQAATIEITDTDIAANTNVVWTADNEYILNGLVFVDPGASLTIQPAPLLRASPVRERTLRHSWSHAAERFLPAARLKTPLFSPLKLMMSATHPTSPLDARGLWGGVIILGNAKASIQSPVKRPLRVYQPPNLADYTAEVMTPTIQAFFATYPFATVEPTLALAMKSTD